MAKKMKKLRQERYYLPRWIKRKPKLKIKEEKPPPRKIVLNAIETIVITDRPTMLLPDPREIETLLLGIKGVQSCHVVIKENTITDIHLVVTVCKNQDAIRKKYLDPVQTAILARYGHNVRTGETNFHVAQMDDLEKRLAEKKAKTIKSLIEKRIRLFGR